MNDFLTKNVLQRWTSITEDFFPYFLEDCNGLFKKVDCNWNSQQFFGYHFHSLISRLDAAEVDHHQFTVNGVHGNLPTGPQFLALEVKRPEAATVTIHHLLRGVVPAEVAARGQSIVTNVVMGTEDVNTSA